MQVTAPEAPAPVRRGRPPQAGLAATRREQILSSAAQAFAERGYEATTAAHLAARAGMGLGTVYRYFDSKREILDHVMDRCVRELVDMVDGRALLVPVDSVDCLVERICGFCERLFGVLEDSPHLLRLILVEASAVTGHGSRRLVRGEHELARLVAAALDHGVARGWLRPDLDADAVSRAILALLWPALLRGLRCETRGVDRTRQHEAVVAMVSFGLRGQGAVPGPVHAAGSAR